MENSVAIVSKLRGVLKVPGSKIALVYKQYPWTTDFWFMRSAPPGTDWRVLNNITNSIWSQL